MGCAKSTTATQPPEAPTRKKKAPLSMKYDKKMLWEKSNDDEEGSDEDKEKPEPIPAPELEQTHTEPYTNIQTSDSEGKTHSLTFVNL